jgi:hypothetical protein
MSEDHNLLRAYRDALISIARYKHTPRAYRHTKFEDLIRIAQEALKQR